MARDTSLYRVDGTRVPSVTEVLRIAGLNSAYSMVAEHVLERAADRGRSVDQWLELIFSGHIEPDAEPPEDIAGYVRAYLTFEKETGFKAEAVELPVVHDRMRYAGQLDRLGTAPLLTKGTALVDLKCVAQLLPATALQLAGYAGALGRPVARYALRLKPDGRYELRSYTDPNDWNVFVSALNVTHWQLAQGLVELDS